jgi:hypothetical protein
VVDAVGVHRTGIRVNRWSKFQGTFQCLQ